jgi:hypothetical protein
MSPQLVYQAIVCVLRATKAVSKRLEPARAASIQKRINTLELASGRAFERGDWKHLRALCDEVNQLGDEVKQYLRV